MRTSGVFVTGTDTGVGKTTFCALLLAYLKSQKISVQYFKPIQTGLDSDSKTVANLARLETREILPPSYEFPEPLSPNRAAQLNGRTIETSRIQSDFQMFIEHQPRVSVVEGVGGLLVPLNVRETVRDLIRSFDLPTVVVASTRLGTINHTLLTIEAARSGGCRIQGLVLNGDEDPGLSEMLTEMTGVPVLASIPQILSFDADAIEKSTTQVFIGNFWKKTFCSKELSECN